MKGYIHTTNNLVGKLTQPTGIKGKEYLFKPVVSYSTYCNAGSTRSYINGNEIYMSYYGWNNLIISPIISCVETIENRYFISSVTDINLFSKAVRQHWGIENSLHWCFDLDFDEDHCRMRVDNSAENFAVLRHIAINLYTSFISSKLSLKAKRFRCSFDDDFLCDVIFNKFN